VVAQRLVETLDHQLSDAKTKYSELEMENKWLKCQLGEATVRPDHDYKDETRVKAELEKAKADIEEHRQCASVGGTL
jgi:regulator of replication initiation timing